MRIIFLVLVVLLTCSKSVFPQTKLDAYEAYEKAHHFYEQNEFIKAADWIELAHMVEPTDLDYLHDSIIFLQRAGDYEACNELINRFSILVGNNLEHKKDVLKFEKLKASNKRKMEFREKLKKARKANDEHKLELIEAERRANQIEFEKIQSTIID